MKSLEVDVTESALEKDRLGGVSSCVLKCHVGTLENEGQLTSGTLLVSASAGKHCISDFAVPHEAIETAPTS